MEVLELVFLKDDGKTTTFSIENPVAPVNEQTVTSVMDTIISTGIFLTLGQHARKKGARIIQKSVSEVKINI
ncbi:MULTISPECIES: DUF2922 domain-containing protein [unclassified Bacillus (in: firmicutes)]|uniref:DUF2922 domain-containing protein n=1 Tax=unclassified Bacillus (in: firmicutes) TaxID=185979 RepID=UPI0008E228EB|nr:MULTISPECIES: DUF2922 domain-containing protein [unclassified Bacillus (in: firmicutes)]SFJ68846.1 Protein of unknown function [Bacillus sp. 71mf]SFT20707.1 Protein of unknown function [Bacillus sp. 103mf]